MFGFSLRTGAVLACAGLTTLAAPAGAATPEACDRHCLVAMVDQYLQAVVAHDARRLPLARNARYTEDGQELDLNDGFWRTASSVGTYKNYFVDPQTSNAGFFGTMRENGNAVILVARLAVVKDRVTEIETLIARPGGTGPMSEGPQLLETLGKPNSLWTQPIPESQRMSREDLIKTADMYFTGLQKNDGKGKYPFTADCNRLENGLQTTNNKTLRFGEGTGGGPGDEFLASFAAMGCKEQFETGYYRFVDRIRDRRFPVVDVERGVVFSLAFFDHSGTVHKIPLTNGKTIEGRVKEPFTWELGEAFKIEKGQIRYVEAVMKRAPYGMKPNWPQ